MSDLKAAILESWDRQSTIINNIAKTITPDQFDFVVAEGEWPVVEHLCHIHSTRRFWLRDMNPDYLIGHERLHKEVDGDWVPIRDIDFIREQLALSAAKVREVVEPLLDNPQKIGSYDHPLFFLQHMVWHEGWHAGSIFAALRVNGIDFDDPWQEENVWGLWRTEETA